MEETRRGGKLVQEVLRLPTGEPVAVIGQGTWHMGEDPRRRTQEIDALRHGIAAGLRLIDTAEIYGVGEAERIVGEAVRDCRASVYVVTKIWPSHARPEAMLRALSRSLDRMGTDYADAVLLHWPIRSLPLSEVLSGLFDLSRRKLARFVGVSNFSLNWLRAADALLKPEEMLAFNQVPYHLGNRRVESGLLEFAVRHHQTVMAYNPLGQGRLHRYRGYAVLQKVAAERGVSPYTVALNWLIGHPGVVAIPKAVRPEHIAANAAALTFSLTTEEVHALHAAFAPSKTKLAAIPPYDFVFRTIQWALMMKNRWSRGKAGAS